METNNDQLVKIPCCPELLKDDNCDVLFFTRTLNYPFSYKQERKIIVQLILGFKLSRCTLGLALGDPVYTTTLLPGEKVRLFSTDRRSKFTFDSSTNLSYRSEQISEEQYFMLATQEYFRDLENTQRGTASSNDQGHWDFHGDADAGLGWFSANASTNESYNYNNSSILNYLYSQSSNMRGASSQAVNATHLAHSISMGEVATRTHSEGQSEDLFESSSREFSNPNSCHAITYIFYRLNKKQILKFELVSLDKIISPTDITNIAAYNPYVITPQMRSVILEELDKELKDAGILDSNGELSDELKRKFDFEMEFSLPTAGIQVKGCLDECSTCEPARKERIHLENELLKKRIELLEKSQEYRCCPPAPIVNNE
jgi:hypothetical protein